MNHILLDAQSDQLVLSFLGIGVGTILLLFLTYHWVRYVHGINEREKNQKEIIRLLKKIANEG